MNIIWKNSNESYWLNIKMTKLKRKLSLFGEIFRKIRRIYSTWILLRILYFTMFYFNIIYEIVIWISTLSTKKNKINLQVHQNKAIKN